MRKQVWELSEAWGSICHNLKPCTLKEDARDASTLCSEV